MFHVKQKAKALKNTGFQPSFRERRLKERGKESTMKKTKKAGFQTVTNLRIKPFGQLTAKETYEILKARESVFSLEQGFCFQDIDGEDYRSIHCFVEDGGKILAYLRAFYVDEDHTAVKVSRILTVEHGLGLGRQLMEGSLYRIWDRMGCEKFVLHTPENARGFFEKFGFKTVSEVFEEDGVLQVAMELPMEM
ncbi:MAG: GNAT family N-acetyltransferase [Clostridiales bacterium]|nr:GNAT family N-acetyltransferase [Clostridiales bacterium]